MMNKILNQRVVLSVLNLGLILILSIVAVAKESSSSNTPTTNSATSIASGIDTGVGAKENFPSLYDGKLNWKLPLMSIGGRGAVGFTPTLQVQGGDWKVESEYYSDEGAGNPTPYFEETIKYEENSTGLNNPLVGYGPGIVVLKRDKYQLYRYGVINNSGITLTRVYFYGAGGGRTEFVDALYKGKPFQLSHTGYRAGSFVSRDGSGMEFISDITVRDTHTTQTNPVTLTSDGDHPSGYLRSTDGKTYRVDNSLISWIRDRNGNTIYFTYSNNAITSATDSNGRTINFEYSVQDASGTYDKISYKGFGGSTKDVKIYRKTLSEILPAGTPHNFSDLFPDFSNEGSCWGNNHNRCVVRDPDANGAFNPTRVSSVIYPDGRGYHFKYNPYGELSKVEYATGSAIEYVYAGVGTELGLNLRDPWENVSQNPDYPSPFYGNTYIHRQLKEVLTYREGNVLENKQSINIQKDNGNTITTSEVFDGQTAEKLSSSKQFFYGYSDPGYYVSFPSYDFYPAWRDGRSYKSEILSPSTASVLKRSETDWQRGGYFTWSDGTQLDINPRVAESRSFDVPSNLQTKTTYSYDQYNNVTDTYEYDFGVGQAGQFLRRSHTDYVDLGEYLRRIPTQSWVSSDIAGGNKVSLTQYEYDNYSEHPLVDRYNVVGHDTANYGTSKTIRGNVTKITSYTDAQNYTGETSTKTQYDILGNVVKMIDAKGNFATLDFSDNFGSPNAEARSNTLPGTLNGQSTFAFATNTIASTGWKTYSQFDYFTGSGVDEEDINGNVNTHFYNSFDRPTQTITANNRPNFRSQSTIAYDDLNRKVITTSDLNTFGDNLIKGESLTDSLGRTLETRAYNENGYVVTEKPQYDALGRVTATCNPYRPYLNEQPVCSNTTFDNLGRPIKISLPDGSEVTSSFNGNVTTVVNQTGKKLRSVTNAFGQIIRVDESDNTNELGDVANPIQPTYYTYNTNGQMVKVTQGQQNRYFLYDSLGRLIRVRQPEQATNSALSLSDPISSNNDWSTALTYDLSGNLLTTTDAKGVINNSTYDVFNRQLTRSYSDGTPTVVFEYDNPIVSNSKGRLTKVSSSISTTEYTNFNVLGGVLNHKQTTDGQSYNTGYVYNLAGNLVEETYPSGRVVKNAYDNNGKLSEVSSKINAQNSSRIYANRFKYNASGISEQIRFGNGKWETIQFNQRLQITQMGLGHSATDSSLWKVNNEYGVLDQTGNFNSQKNDGNIARQTTNFAGLSTPFVTTFQYDALNRLTEAKETQANQQNWKQNWSYDKYGNRTSLNQIVGQIVTDGVPQIDLATNRFVAGQGYFYDNNGNLGRTH
jgi:YD repeat-containing protein